MLTREVSAPDLAPSSTPTTSSPDSLGAGVASIALIGPAESRRKALGDALESLYGSVTREFSQYPEMDDLPQLLEGRFDVIIVELDSNPEYALEVVENICSKSPVTVMVYSDKVSPEMLVQCMRAGAREFLAPPISSTTIVEAMARASVRRPVAQSGKKATGKLLIFVGAKGGSGVTTVASNFAVSLAGESKHTTALIDLNLPIGNAALDLGLTSQYSTADALRNYESLDSNYLSKLVTRHDSGLTVLAAPDQFAAIQPTNEAIERLLSVARQDFDYVVIDAGSRFESISKSLFEPGSTVYLVLQVGVTELRNASRLISEFFKAKDIKLEVVLNRFATGVLSIDDAIISKALSVAPTWKIPGDFPAVWSAQNAATPLALTDSPISQVIRQMSGSAWGSPDVQEKKKEKKWFGLFK